MAVIKGNKNTIELTFTPSERPKKKDARIRCRILLCLTNFIIKSKELHRKKI